MQLKRAKLRPYFTTYISFLTGFTRCAVQCTSIKCILYRMRKAVLLATC